MTQKHNLKAKPAKQAKPARKTAAAKRAIPARKTVSAKKTIPTRAKALKASSRKTASHKRTALKRAVKRMTASKMARTKATPRKASRPTTRPKKSVPPPAPSPPAAAPRQTVERNQENATASLPSPQTHLLLPPPAPDAVTPASPQATATPGAILNAIPAETTPRENAVSPSVSPSPSTPQPADRSPQQPSLPPQQPETATAPGQGELFLQVKVRRLVFFPVKGIEVLLLSDGKRFKDGVSDRRGIVNFTQLSAGKYSLSVTHNGKTKVHDIALNTSRAKLIDI